MSQVGSMSIHFARHCNAFNFGRAMTSSVFMKTKHFNSEVQTTNSYCTKANSVFAQSNLGRDLLLANSSFPNIFVARPFHSSFPVLSQSGGEPEKPAEAKAASPIKEAVKLYGKTVIVVYVSVGLVNLSICYLAIANGVDMVGILSKLPYLGEKVASSAAGAGASTFVVAYFVHKMMAPIRISATLAITPLIVRVLRARGILKH